MRYSGADRDDDEPWFTIGQLQVNSTILIAVVWVATLLIWTVEGNGGPVNSHLVLINSSVSGSGELWRVVTWPWSHISFQLGNVIAIALFVLFGLQLERQVGRRSFAALLASSIVIIGVVAVLIGALLSRDYVIYDIELLELTVVLLFCAEAPTRPFFFGIPAWVIAAVITALEFINDIADRDWVRMLTVIIAAGLITLVARKVGLLSDYDRIPDLKVPGSQGRRERAAAREAEAHPPPRPTGRAGRPPAAPEPKRPGPLWRKKDDAPAEIVPMPTSSRRRPIDPVVHDMSADDLALDLLLDKIADGGLDALSSHERQQLDELRARRRKT